MLVKLSGQGDASSILEDKQTRASAHHAVQLLKPVWWVFLNHLEHLAANVSKNLEAVSLDLPWLAKPSEEFSNQKANLLQLDRFDQVLLFVVSDLAPADLHHELVKQLADFGIWGEHSLLI